MNWDEFQPSNGRVHGLDERVGIHKTSGAWNDFGFGQVEMVGICEIGKCIPDDIFFVSLPPAKVEFKLCPGDTFDGLPTHNVYVSDGCNESLVDFKDKDHQRYKHGTALSFTRVWRVFGASRFNTHHEQEVHIVYDDLVCK
eukprot:TRINITY_DN1502_c0_g1_i2.p1 TRINITY_DN1502_c0_g1~~TRINITY_DN1502_c0_g1_i2.p1  ORF type:complete len:141 (-),score=22.66 TRINITY_DN1502_c0_g1_i2:132-554(-)